MLRRHKSPLSTDGQGPRKSGLEKQPTAHSPNCRGQNPRQKGEGTYMPAAQGTGPVEEGGSGALSAQRLGKDTGEAGP